MQLPLGPIRKHKEIIDAKAGPLFWGARPCGSSQRLTWSACVHRTWCYKFPSLGLLLRILHAYTRRLANLAQEVDKARHRRSTERLQRRRKMEPKELRLLPCSASRYWLPASTFYLSSKACCGKWSVHVLHPTREFENRNRSDFGSSHLDQGSMTKRIASKLVVGGGNRHHGTV